MEKILIELILTNRCNKRCEYCDLDFKDKSLSFRDIDLFIDFLKNNKAEYTINFFGGEPLLSYDKIKYFLENGKEFCTRFFIGTNGILLNREKLEFFKQKNVNILLTIDNILSGNDLDLTLISEYSDIIKVNFINDPDYLSKSILVYEKIKSSGFKNIAFMPIFATKKRTKIKLIVFKKVFQYVKNNSTGIDLEVYSYFNGTTSDRQFILDTDGYFYSDFDGHLWLQKQYKSTSTELENEINKKSKLFSLSDNNISLDLLLKLYNLDEILKLFFKIPAFSGDLLSYKIIDNILEKNGK